MEEVSGATPSASLTNFVDRGFLVGARVGWNGCGNVQMLVRWRGYCGWGWVVLQLGCLGQYGRHTKYTRWYVIRGNSLLHVIYISHMFAIHTDVFVCVHTSISTRV